MPVSTPPISLGNAYVVEYETDSHSHTSQHKKSLVFAYTAEEALERLERRVIGRRTPPPYFALWDIRPPVGNEIGLIERLSPRSAAGITDIAEQLE